MAELLVVDGGLLEVEGDSTASVVITPPPTSIVSTYTKISNKAIYHTIAFVVTLADTSVGGEDLVGTSEKVKENSISFVLKNQTVDVECTHPTSGAITMVTVKVKDAGQIVVKAV